MEEAGGLGPREADDPAGGEAAREDARVGGRARVEGAPRDEQARHEAAAERRHGWDLGLGWTVSGWALGFGWFLGQIWGVLRCGGRGWRWKRRHRGERCVRVGRGTGETWRERARVAVCVGSQVMPALLE